MGEGSFGEVYQIRHVATNKFYAAKFDKKGWYILNEIVNLKKLTGRTAVPYVLDFKTKQSNVMIMELLGKSLSALHSSCKK